jgi:transcriptional regulator with XRE-family HTH domain
MPRQKSTHVDDPTAVGRRLRAARERTGLSQRQLAFPGCSPAYISRIESGDRIPSLQLLRELGRRLGVTEDWLATGSEHGPSETGGRLLEAEIAVRLDDLGRGEEIYTQVLEESGADETRARAFEGLGQIEHRRGRPQAAIERFEQALALYGTPEATHPDLAESLGRSYARADEPERAIGVFERCLGSAVGDGDVLGEARFLVLLGSALVDAGDVGRAQELLGRAVAIGKGSDSPGVRARLYWTQSRLHAERNEPEPAARSARRALELLGLTEDTYRAAKAYQLLAHIELDRDRADEALRVLEEGRPLLERSASPVERARYGLEEARALARLGRTGEAATAARGISAVLAGARHEEAARGYAILAEVYEDIGDRARALELSELAAELLREEAPKRDS